MKRERYENSRFEEAILECYANGINGKLAPTREQVAAHVGCHRSTVIRVTHSPHFTRRLGEVNRIKLLRYVSGLEMSMVEAAKAGNVQAFDRVLRLAGMGYRLVDEMPPPHDLTDSDYQSNIESPIDLGRAILRGHYQPQNFHKIINEHLIQVANGDIKRLIINMPPRHGKTELCSRLFPPWYLATNAGSDIIATSYAMSLARSIARTARNYAMHPAFGNAFHLTIDRQGGAAAHDWSLSNGSTYYAAGVEGGITGYGANVLLIDDPIKDTKQANSAVYRERIKDWFRDAVLTRLTPDGAIIIIMTRWHHDDLVGWVLRDWPTNGWTKLVFPAIQDRDPVDYDPREPGDVLWPERYTEADIAQIQEAMGAVAFNKMYQQKPSVEEGAVINIHDLVQDFDLESPPAFLRIISSWDTAFEETRMADYSVGTVWGETDTGYYLLDVIRGRWKFPDLKRRMITAQERWNADAVLIEKAASGRDLRHELHENTTMPIIPVTPVGDKVSRAAAITGRIEAGRVHIPRSAPWLAPLLTELEYFPEVDHDDQVDSFTQAIRWITRYGGSAIDRGDTHEHA